MGNYRGKGIHDQCRASHGRLAYLEDVRWPMRNLAAFVELPAFKGDKCPARIPPNGE
jgi:hypothetical protein